MDELRKIRTDIEKTGKGGTREAAIITSSEIERMKRTAKVMSKADQ